MVSLTQNLPKTLGSAYERHGRWLPQAARLIFVVVLARLLADFVWLWIPTPEAAAWRPAPVTPAAAVADGAASGPNAELVASAHLFGDYRAPVDPVVAEIAAAPDTRLNLTLLGILAADRDRESRALIGTQGGEEKPYSVGDDVVRGVSLQAIFADRVILSRGGQLETLRLDKDSPGAPLPPGPISAREAPAEDGHVVDDATTEQLAQIREQILQDPSKASDYIRVQPASVNGQQRGYRIYPGRDRAVFNGAGLRPGDLVTTINGVQLDDPARALQMLGDLSQAATLNLTIERGGVQQTVTVNLN